MDSVILARHGESVFSARHLVNGDAAVDAQVRVACAAHRCGCLRGEANSSRHY